MTSDGDLAGKTGLVTGAASGLGAAIAQRLGAAGATVGLIDLDDEGLREVTAELDDGTGRVRHAVADVTDDATLDAAADQLFGDAPLDFAVACAGIPGEGRADQVSLERWNHVLAVNLTGVWLTARTALARMTDSGGGSIVMISSIAGTAGLPGIAAYAAAKGGVISLARQMARDFAHADVRVNAVCPGPIRTPLVEKAWSERGVSFEEGTAHIPLRRLGQPGDVAAVTHLLVGPDGTWITGETITVDGGISRLIGGAAAPDDHGGGAH